MQDFLGDVELRQFQRTHLRWEPRGTASSSAMVNARDLRWDHASTQKFQYEVRFSLAFGHWRLMLYFRFAPRAVIA